MYNRTETGVRISDKVSDGQIESTSATFNA